MAAEDTETHTAEGPPPPARPRLRSGALMNVISRRTLTLVALLGGAVPAYLLASRQPGWAVLVGWLALYALVGSYWLRDAITESPTFLGPSRAVRPLLLAAVFGVIGASPILVFENDHHARASLTLLALSLSLAASAAALKKPASGIGYARAVLAVTLAGWAAAQGDVEVLFMLQVVAAWLFAEILSRRSAYLRRRFKAAAASHANVANALRAKTRELQESNSSRVRILGTVSHEIRQPVHALGMMVERLRIDPHSTEFRVQLDEIASVVRSLAHSLALLLDISRLDAGTVKVKKSISPVQALLERIRREFAVDAKRKGLKFECDSDLNAKIDTDFALFYGAVANFVSNAIRYTDRGYVKVSLSQRNKDELWLHVKDSGRGIPDDKFDDIFNEYVRLDRENQAAQGFGLGLAIVKRTAQLLDLTIEVDSVLGKGSEFRISVPCSSQTQSMTPGATTMARPSTVSRSLVGLRVVLVDNDESVLRGIDSMVRSWGCVPLSCQSVAELAGKLAHMPGTEFDCVVADFHLGAGEPNGLDAIELVRKSMSRFVSATLFTGDLSIRSADLPLPDVHVAHKPVVPARICVMFEEMAAESKRRRPEEDSEAALEVETLSESMPLASAYSYSNHPAMLQPHEAQVAAEAVLQGAAEAGIRQPAAKPD
ncbi:HAMP domain-containing histidine kinase [Pelomonas sp. P7]|uniref:histidine kinase n=1 Tax=Pelomonas caseinilytica TaxID=2906763 RepID=A0ABS8XLE6_9BURK|nr:HAMP domain-containing sensor histidine kinase [Pelomonas sp. P7]MCE4540397.1 HAMP domain-containing histidine kinase [Pelomonas sp. P7]